MWNVDLEVLAKSISHEKSDLAYDELGCCGPSSSRYLENIERVESGRNKVRCKHGELGIQHKRIQSKEERQRKTGRSAVTPRI